MRKHQHGYTLLEILMTMGLSTILMLALIQLFISQKRLYDHSQALMQTQQNAYWAIAILKQAIHHAGYIGCVKLNGDSDIRNTTTTSINVHNYLETNGQSLTVRYLSPQTAILSQNMMNHYQLTTDQTIQFKPGDIIMISDCEKADIIKVAQVAQKSKQQIITLEKNSRQYQPGSQVGKLQVETYYIAENKRNDQQAKPMHSLSINNQVRQDELIERVDDMQFILHHQNNSISVQIQLRFDGLMPETVYAYVSSRVRG